MSYGSTFNNTFQSSAQGLKPITLLPSESGNHEYPRPRKEAAQGSAIGSNLPDTGDQWNGHSNNEHGQLTGAF